MQSEKNETEVKVIAQRYVDRPHSDPDTRSWVIADHVRVEKEKIGSSRMYVGDAFRTVVLTLAPGVAQKLHMHPATDHAWFIVSGTGEVTLEDGKREIVKPGVFMVHPRNSVHGIRCVGDETLVYIALSTGD
jgi:mannose-6-phosphate isomerase-like protein (cupin superfamily)